MPYQIQLNFLRSLLRELHISSTVVTSPTEHIPPEIDLHLRGELFGLSNYTGFLQNSMAQAKDKTLYRFYDEYDCNYIFLRLPDARQDRYFFIGPYLLQMPDRERIARKAETLLLTEEQTRQMQLYYTALPIVETETLLLCAANAFAKELWGADRYAMEYVDYAIPDRYDPVPTSMARHIPTDRPISLDSLVKNYAAENQLIEAVSKGKLHRVTAPAATVFNNSAEQRLSDSLRDRKNNLIILKTLLRKAAEYGGVHPLHIHSLSSHYAEEIENIHTIKQSLSLQENMIRDFCLLVKEHSLSKYSDYVAKAITLVHYDLTADLSLKRIAAELNVNASYLSALFHRECGCTLTEFVNKQRMEHALFLLADPSKTVQAAAEECGIHDVNYFIKLFKKHTSMTPTQYRARIHPT